MGDEGNAHIVEVRDRPRQSIRISTERGVMVKSLSTVLGLEGDTLG